MVKQANGIPKIDAAMCNGCELCAKRCKFHAIELIPREKGGKA
ncbi:4Fe-4S binding protein [Ruminococcus callidus]